MQCMYLNKINLYCDEWNEFMLKSLLGDTSICVACDSKKDNITNLAEINIPDKPSTTGNLTKELNIKIGARVMIITNIDISDRLTNGVMGTTVNILKDEEVNVKVILVKFDDSDVGQSAKSQSLYKKVNRNAVPIVPFQALFQINSSSSCTASRLQFLLKLSWAVMIHKCQGLTLELWIKYSLT